MRRQYDNCVQTSVEITSDVRVTLVRCTFAVQPFLPVRGKCVCRAAVERLPYFLLTTSTKHAVLKRKNVAASFVRHPQGQRGTITSLLLPPYELTATLFFPSRPLPLSTAAKKKKKQIITGHVVEALISKL